MLHCAEWGRCVGQIGQLKLSDLSFSLAPHWGDEGAFRDPISKDDSEKGERIFDTLGGMQSFVLEVWSYDHAIMVEMTTTKVCHFMVAPSRMPWSRGIPTEKMTSG